MQRDLHSEIELGRSLVPFLPLVNEDKKSPMMADVLDIHCSDDLQKGSAVVINISSVFRSIIIRTKNKNEKTRTLPIVI